jgi:hypothetical protein
MRQGNAILPTRSSIPSLLVHVQYCRRLRRMHVNANAEASPASRIGTVAERCSRDAQFASSLMDARLPPVILSTGRHRITVSARFCQRLRPADFVHRFVAPVRPPNDACAAPYSFNQSPLLRASRPFHGADVEGRLRVERGPTIESYPPRDDARMAGSVWPPRRDLEKPTSHERLSIFPFGKQELVVYLSFRRIEPALATHRREKRDG